MTEAGLDLKHPGGKELLVVGGGALGLALIYFALKGKIATGQGGGGGSTPGTGGGLGSTGFASTTGGPGRGGLAGGGGMRAAGGPFTGNAFTDADMSSPLPVPGGPKGGPPTRQPRNVLLPVQHAVQGAQEILGSGRPSSVLNAGMPAAPAAAAAPAAVPPAPSTGGPAPGGAKAVYQALIRAGLLPFQAAGVMGNMLNESTYQGIQYNPEAIGDQGTSFGLIQWHNTSYPNAAAYVTGNVAKDFQNQITAVAQLFKQHNIGGTTAGQVAGNWASQIEGCVGCQPGGSQYSGRVFNADVIYQDILAGRYNVLAPKAKPVANVKPATPAQIRNLFPIVKPRPRPAPRRPVPRRAGTAVANVIARAAAVIAAAVRGRPPPRPAYRPVPLHGPGHPLLH